MSRDISIDGYFIHSMTKIVLRENYDGIHVREKVIGYVTEEPFCVLTELLSKYYVSMYNIEEIFPVGFFSGNYTIGIRSLGSRYILSNFTKHPYFDLSRFLLDHKSDMSLAEVDKDAEPELADKYTELLRVAIDNKSVPIKLAISYAYIVDKVADLGTDIDEFNKKIHQYFTDIDTSNMDTLELQHYLEIQQYVFKRLAEVCNRN